LQRSFPAHFGCPFEASARPSSLFCFAFLHPLSLRSLFSEILGAGAFRADAVLWLITLAGSGMSVVLLAITHRLTLIFAFERYKIQLITGGAAPPSAANAKANANDGAARDSTTLLPLASDARSNTPLFAPASAALPVAAPTTRTVTTATATPLLRTASLLTLSFPTSSSATAPPPPMPTTRRLFLFMAAFLTPILIDVAVFLEFDTSHEWRSYFFSYWNYVVLGVCLL
jgi:hypothetical protein